MAVQMSKDTVRIDGWATLSPRVPGEGPITSVLVERGEVVVERDLVTYALRGKEWVEIHRGR